MSALDYAEWNRALLDHFFRRANRHRPVRLRLDDEVLEQAGGTKNDLVAAALAEAERRGCQDIQELGLDQYREWMRAVGRARYEGEEIPPPPFLPILGLFVLAVNHGGDELGAPHSYYPRLHELLGEPGHRIGSIDPSLVLWLGLTEWSSQMLGGRLGVFEFAIVGHQVPVGFPRRQVLLATREIPALKEALLQKGILPGSNPTDASLVEATRGARRLKARTKKLLSAWPSEDNAHELLKEIRSEFEAWDHLDETDLGAAPGGRLPLRLALKYSRNTILDWFLETETIAGLTDGERSVSLDAAGAGSTAPAIELVPMAGSDTSRLCAADSGAPWKPENGMLTPVRLLIEGTGFVLTRTGSPCAILDMGARPGVLHECEQGELEAGRAYLLVAPGAELGTQRFVDRFEGPWADLEIDPSLQKRVFVAGSTEGKAPRTTLECIGGLRTMAGTRAYLPFALPDVRVESAGGFDALELQIQYFDENGRPTSDRILGHLHAGRPEGPLRGTTTGHSCVVQLPDPPANAGSCKIGLEEGGQEIAARVILLDRSPDPITESGIPERDALGEIASTGTPPTFRGLEVVVRSTEDPPERPLQRKPCHSEELPPRDEAALRAMHLLRSSTPIRWGKARRGFQLCLAPHGGDEIAKGHLAFEVSILHSLGVLEIREGVEIGWDRLFAIRPSIVLLPSMANLLTPGSPFREGEQALLTGCWLDGEIEALRREARRSGVELLEARGDPKLSLIPNRRVLVAEGDRATDRIARLGELLGRPWPQSCRIAATVDCLPRIAEAEGWIPGGISGAWRVFYFDPRSLDVSDRMPDEGDRFVLAECAQHERPGWRFFVLDTMENRRLQLADRQLGRWFVRISALPDHPVPECGGDLILPWELQLPRIVERILVLATGRAPWVKRYEPGRSPFLTAGASRTFGIPAPPERAVPWFESRNYCSGNFVCYPEACTTGAWPRGSPMPMIGARAERVSGANMES